MARCPHLYKRNGVFYWRRVLPADLEKKFGKFCTRISTRTQIPFEAMKRARALSSSADQVFDWLRIMTKLGQYIDGPKLKTTLTSFFNAEVRAAMISASLADMRDVADASSLDGAFSAKEQALTDAIIRRDTSLVRDRLNQTFKGLGIDVPADSDDFKVAARSSLFVAREAMRVNAARERGENPKPELDWSSLIPFDLPSEQSETPAPVAVVISGPEQDLVAAGNGIAGQKLREPMSKVMADMRKDYATHEHCKKTDADHERAANLLIEFIGDKPLYKYDASDALEFKSKLTEVPALHGKGPFTGLTTLASIKKANEMEQKSIQELKLAAKNNPRLASELAIEIEKAKIARLSPSTINKHMRACGAVYKWLEKRDPKAHGRVPKPFACQGFSKKAVREATNKRIPWRDHELKALIETAAWTGCSSRIKRHKPGNLIIKDKYYWVILILAFMGLRLEEACQAHLSDIYEIDGISVLWVHKGYDKRLKTEYSERIIPIHPALIKLGLLDYVRGLKDEKYTRLFPDLMKDNIHDRYGTSLSEWFTRYRRYVGMYKKLKDAHSLRHTFDTYMQNLDVSPTRVAELLGHAQKGETNTTYYHGAELRKLAEAIARWDFGLHIEMVNGEYQIVRPSLERAIAQVNLEAKGSQKGAIPTS